MKRARKRRKKKIRDRATRRKGARLDDKLYPIEQVEKYLLGVLKHRFQVMVMGFSVRRSIQRHETKDEIKLHILFSLRSIQDPVTQPAIKVQRILFPV